MNLTNILPQEALLTACRASSKKRILKDIAEAASRFYRLDSKAVLSALQQREDLGSTAMGGGVAIPHARVAGLDQVKGIFARLETPFDFGASDGQPVDIVFALLAPEDAGADHLKALARVSRVLRQSETRRKLRSTSNPEALYSVLCEMEKAHVAA